MRAPWEPAWFVQATTYYEYVKAKIYQLIRLNHIKVPIFILTDKNDNFIGSTCYILEPNDSDLSPARRWVNILRRLCRVYRWWPSLLPFRRPWVEASVPTEVDQSGRSVFFCLQTSFVIFKIAVNIPLNGTASAHHIEFSLLKETTQGLRVLWMWHVTDTDIMVAVTSQTSGTSAIYLSCSPDCHENRAKRNILRVRIIKNLLLLWNLAFGSCILAGI